MYFGVLVGLISFVNRWLKNSIVSVVIVKGLIS